jgi:hypothetical protein
MGEQPPPSVGSHLNYNERIDYMKMFHCLKIFIVSVWRNCNSCRIRQTLLIATPIFVVFLLYIFRAAIMNFLTGVAAIIFLVFLFKPDTVTNTVNHLYKAERVAELMTELLTLLHADIGIRKPYDVYSVWKNPTRNGAGWAYHTKARQSDSVQLDTDSLAEYISLINGRAQDIGAPLTVTAIHPRGNTFIYDVTVTDAVMAYRSPAEVKAVDRDF